MWKKFALLCNSLSRPHSNFFPKTFDPSMKPCPNGGSIPPSPNSILIWKSFPTNQSPVTALITEVNQTFITIAENRFSSDSHTTHTRQIPIKKIQDQFFIEDKDEVLGWMVFYSHKSFHSEDSQTVKKITKLLKYSQDPWIDPTIPSQLFWKQLWGNEQSRDNEATFYVFPKDYADKIQSATEELNQMCLKAVNFVIHSDELLQKFQFPEWIWPKIRKSWALGTETTLAGRFDFGFSKTSLKLLEFNADSAGTYLECAVIQDLWANSVGCNIGQSAGQSLEPSLVSKSKEIFPGFTHLMIDNDTEEMYNTLFIQETLQKAGIQSKVIVGTQFSEQNGKFFDSDGKEIRSVWKMWNWETVIKDFSKEREGNELKISDLLLCDDVQVVEPLWKVVCSSKAMLPVLWQMFPNHPLLLRAEWDMRKRFDGKGVVRKPIVGRCGQGVKIFFQDSDVEEGGDGVVYQELLEIQEFGGFFPVIGAWIVGSAGAGFGIREDKELITDHISPYACCRIVS